jgi:hypothetical protein
MTDDEYNRDERIETIYQGWGAREMAERIVDLEDELGAEVDGICTGMYANVAEAHDEIERLNSIVGYYEFRAEEDAARARQKIESVERASDDVTRGYNAAMSDLELQEKALKEARADADYFKEWAAGNGHRLNAALSERDRYRLAWTSARIRVKRARWAGVSDLRFTRNMWADAVRDLTRYRLAWLSARRRAADEANYGLEALDLKAAEITRLTADRDAWQRGHETAESQLVYERRENANLRAELADLREAIHEES